MYQRQTWGKFYIPSGNQQRSVIADLVRELIVSSQCKRTKGTMAKDTMATITWYRIGIQIRRSWHEREFKKHVH